MGLSVSHGCWQGPYSSFTEWRRVVARYAGIKLHLMYNYWYPIEEIKQSRTLSIIFTQEMIDDIEKYSKIRNLPIPWKEYENDPLTVLLAHSDCDGSIEAKDCGPLADRLQEISKKIPPARILTLNDINNPEHWKHLGYDLDKLLVTLQGIENETCNKGRTEVFITGLRDAVAKNESVQFG